MKFNFKTSYIVIAVVIVFVLLLFGGRIFKIIDPGERGVIFKPYTSGLDKENIFGEGFHIIAPWNELHIYNVREQQRDEPMDVLDRNGLSISMDITVRFNPSFSQIGFLHEQFGINYINVLVIPEVRSSVRQVAGRYAAEEIYSTKRAEVEQAIITETKIVLERNSIDMKALLIRSINLPEQIKNAIESKLQQEQEALAYEFRLQRETSEAERRRIEADGIAAYNRIINSSLTDKILLQRGIEATTVLAESPNSKVIVIGGGKDGLPLILGNN
ncbi:MAG: prohibitin family protein [Prolixibacteraceae bacterium]|jgi:regulator of protease activity HflC (stomatin/prohibitin superfamily)|nr:prohibitin family protein [Prolixibacteraceae bacterium]MBT6007223.1 prohibitin family protein [Prolixibacteraceae bacterium]MBT6766199.1 prohibitin family protein [Prolixibacteraceae bacterium]MBT7395453.1 prohibitin family protein [Prolixibacteraceae bacterium]